jgi:hypothetical protein
LAKFEVIVICPLHPKSIGFHVVEAKDEFEAYGKAIGEKAICTFPPGHRFVIHAENIVGWQPLAPLAHPGRPPAYVPPVPSEKIYYVEPKIGLERLKRKTWWKD